MCYLLTSTYDVATKSLANGLVGTGFIFQYWLQDLKGPLGRCKPTTLSSLSVTT